MRESHDPHRHLENLVRRRDYGTIRAYPGFATLRNDDGMGKVKKLLRGRAGALFSNTSVAGAPNR
jgi:hypothetical protein